MKLFFKIFLLSFVAVIIAAPYGIGFIAEHYFYKHIAQINTAPIGINVKGKFTRGYLKSEAITTVNFKGDNKKFNLYHTIFQGPVILDIFNPKDYHSYRPKDLKLAVIETRLDSAYDAKLAVMYKKADSYNIQTKVGLNLSTKTKISNQPLTFSLNDAEELQWGGVDVTITHHQGLNKFDIAAELPSLYYKDPLQNVQVDKIKLSAQQPSIFELNGKTEFTIDAIHFNENSSSKTVKIENVNFLGFSETIDKMLNFTNKFSINRMLALDKEYGPSEFKLEIQNLYEPTLRTIWYMLADFKAQTEEQAAQELQPIVMEARKLLPKQPKMLINGKFKIPQGIIKFATDIRIGDPNMAIDSEDWQTQAIDSINIESKFNVDKVVLYDFIISRAEEKLADPEEIKKHTIAILTPLLENNLLIETENDFSTNITYNKNKILIQNIERTKQELDEITTTLLNL